MSIQRAQPAIQGIPQSGVQGLVRRIATSGSRNDVGDTKGEKYSPRDYLHRCDVGAKNFANLASVTAQIVAELKLIGEPFDLVEWAVEKTKKGSYKPILPLHPMIISITKGGFKTCEEYIQAHGPIVFKHQGNQKSFGGHIKLLATKDVMIIKLPKLILGSNSRMYAVNFNKSAKFRKFFTIAVAWLEKYLLNKGFDETTISQYIGIKRSSISVNKCLAPLIKKMYSVGEEQFTFVADTFFNIKTEALTDQSNVEVIPIKPTEEPISAQEEPSDGNEVNANSVVVTTAPVFTLPGEWIDDQTCKETYDFKPSTAEQKRYAMFAVEQENVVYYSPLVIEHLCNQRGFSSVASWQVADAVIADDFGKDVVLKAGDDILSQVCHCETNIEGEQVWLVHKSMIEALKEAVRSTCLVSYDYLAQQGLDSSSINNQLNLAVARMYAEKIALSLQRSEVTGNMYPLVPLSFLE